MGLLVCRCGLDLTTKDAVRIASDEVDGREAGAAHRGTGHRLVGRRQDDRRERWIESQEDAEAVTPVPVGT